jgi:cellulose biosynthesis protein BcsQ
MSIDMTHKRLRKLLRALEDRYDRIILDCPPGLTEISEQIFRAADLIVVPIPPSPLAIRAYQDVAAHFGGQRREGREIMPVLSMVDLRRKLHREAVDARPDWAWIPQASVAERMAVERAPLAAFAPRCAAAQAFAALWSDIEDPSEIRRRTRHGPQPLQPGTPPHQPRPLPRTTLSRPG